MPENVVTGAEAKCRAAVPKVLLLGIDALDWKVVQELISRGELPVLKSLIENGVAGPIATLRPLYSPALWTSIATGKRPFKHGVLGFTEPAPPPQGRIPVTSRARRTKAIWNILSQCELPSLVVNWWATFPAEPIRGVQVSDVFRMARKNWNEPWPIPAGAVQPAAWLAALAEERVHPQRLDESLVREILPRLDELEPGTPHLALLAKYLAEDATALRILSRLMKSEPWQFATVYLTGPDNFGHAFSHYRTPRVAGTSEHEAELCEGVLDRSYSLYDRWIGKIIAQAGEGTDLVIVSDHGFVTDHRRVVYPGNEECAPCAMHRPEAMLILHGSGFAGVKKVEGSSILDVTPTLLSVFNLPAGADMDGRSLLGGKSVESWDTLEGNAGLNPATVELDESASAAFMKRLESMGYVAVDTEIDPVKIEEVQTAFSRGFAYLDAGDTEGAVALLLHAFRLDPLRSDIIDPLLEGLEAANVPEMAAECLEEHLNARIADAEKARTQLQEFEEKTTDQIGQIVLGRLKRAALNYRAEFPEVNAPFLRALIAHYRGEHAEALRRLREFDAKYPGIVLVQFWLAKLGAENGLELLREVVAREPDNAEAWRLLSAHEEEAAREAARLRPVWPARVEFREDTPLPGLLPTKLVRPRAERMERLEGSFDPANEVVIVTGLPRSGTSLLMQMLEAGGLPVYTDRVRKADEHNPRGYFEVEEVKGIIRGAAFLSETKGKVVKITAPLVCHVPRGVKCSVLFLQRDVREVLASQKRMVGDTSDESAAELAVLEASVEQTEIWLNASQHRWMRVLHQELMTAPEKVAESVSEFLGGKLDVSRMVGCVDVSLYRNRRCLP